MSNEINELKNKEIRSGQNGNVVMAIVFIILGVVLIFGNVTGLTFDNWWVLFMLIPVGFFVQGIYRDYQANGRLTQHSTGFIMVTLAILASAAVFIFEALTWGMIWPVGLIFAGLAIFLGNRS